MKRILTLVLTFYVLGGLAQNIKPIDEISFGVNYTSPSGIFYSSSKVDGNKVIAESFNSDLGFSVGLLNIGRKAKLFQFLYGVEFNYLSASYEVDYEKPSFDSTKWYGQFLIEDYLEGKINSMLISIPLEGRLNFINTKYKIPLFIDFGLKYDFITAYNTSYKLNKYVYNSSNINYNYSSEVEQKNSRFFNKKSNLGLSAGIGTTIKQISLKLSYTHSLFQVKTSIRDSYGRGKIKMSYLNFSVNYKLRK